MWFAVVVAVSIPTCFAMGDDGSLEYQAAGILDPECVTVIRQGQGQSHKVRRRKANPAQNQVHFMTGFLERPPRT